MAIVNGYVTLAQLKRRLRITDGDDNALLEEIITQVSRRIEQECGGRRFYPTTETRVFTATEGGRLIVGDLLSVSADGLKTDDDGDGVYENTFALTDYRLWPLNAAAKGEPYWEIRRTSGGAYSFPLGDGLVQIAGVWGYSQTTPDVIARACLFQCALDFHAKDAPDGVSGSGEFQQSINAVGLHPFVVRDLQYFRDLAAA